MTRPRIIIVENSVAPTGALYAILRNAILLRDAYDFYFVVPSQSTAHATISEAGFRVEELPMREISKRWQAVLLYVPMLLLNAFRFSRILRRTGASLVISNDLYNLVPPIYRMCAGRMPYIVYVRFMPGRFPSWLWRIWFWFHARYAVSTIAVSKAVAAALPLHLNSYVIYDGLPVAREGDGQPVRNNKIILCLANFTQGKGQEHALHAFARIYRDYPDWTLKFAGGDMGLSKNMAFRDSLQLLATQLGISKQTVFAGFADDARALYHEADFLLNFSESESFSLTCLEAQYYGRAVIATRSGGPAEIIENGVTGFLVANGDVTAMAYHMKQLMTDDTLLKSMSRNAHEQIRRRFSPENTSARFAAEIRRSLNSIILNTR